MTLPFRCPPLSAPVRSPDFFSAPDGCNIAPGKEPAMEAASGNSENFRQRFSGADFCCRQTTASCTFVCRKIFRHTKVQLAVVWRQQKSAPENLCLKFSEFPEAASMAGSFPGAILQPSGAEKKSGERTGADRGGHRNGSVTSDCILQQK